MAENGWEKNNERLQNPSKVTHWKVWCSLWLMMLRIRLVCLHKHLCFLSQPENSGNDVHSKLEQTWSTSLFSEKTPNSDSARNTIPLIIYIQSLSITYAYKLDPRLSNRSYGIFKVSAGSQQVTLVRERYRQDAASGSLLPLNTFHFSLVWQAPEEHTDIHDLSSPVDVGGFECVSAVGNNLESG